MSMDFAKKDLTEEDFVCNDERYSMIIMAVCRKA